MEPVYKGQWAGRDVHCMYISTGNTNVFNMRVWPNCLICVCLVVCENVLYIQYITRMLLHLICSIWRNFYCSCLIHRLYVAVCKKNIWTKACRDYIYQTVIFVCASRSLHGSYQLNNAPIWYWYFGHKKTNHIIFTNPNIYIQEPFQFSNSELTAGRPTPEVDRMTWLL